MLVAGAPWAASDAFQAPLLVIAAILILHAATEAFLVYGVHAKRYAPDQLSAFSDFTVAYIGVIYATRPQVGGGNTQFDDIEALANTRQQVALLAGVLFVAYALLSLAAALPPFQRPRASRAEWVSNIKTLTLPAAAVLLLVVRDTSPLDSAHTPPSIVCRRPYTERAEFLLHMTLLVFAAVQTGFVAVNACTGCCYDDAVFSEGDKEDARVGQNLQDQQARLAFQF